MSDVALKNLNKTYDNGFHAVHDFSIDIKHGEFIVFVGPSGCGKTTTLRMIAGLEEITSGELYVDGKKCNDLASKDRDIAMVFQNYALYSHMTVYHNMAFSLVLRKENADIIHEKVMNAAKVLELTDQLNKLPRQLSGGQRQRVALGRAIVRDPKVFLLDEPLSNLDAKLRGSMRLELGLLHKKLGATFIYVTHDQIEALTLATRIVIMKKGYVMQIGTPLEVYEKPQNLFVAGFIGQPSMNFYDVTVTDEDTIEFGCSSIKLGGKYIDALTQYVGKQVVLGIRPEHFTLSNEGILVEITVVENLGSSSLIHGIICGTKSIIKLDDWQYLKVGDTITVSPDLSQIHLFDKSTENVIAKKEEK